MSQDDIDWLDALAGREAGAANTRREAIALRGALRDAGKVTALEPRDEIGAARREMALIDRAVSEGLIARTPRRAARWQWPLAASVLLAIGASLVFQWQPRGPSSDVVRGDDRGIVHLTANDPARMKRDILAELRAAGIEATGYEALDVHGIDADLPLPVSAEVRRVLDAHGIATPADGVLRVEIRKAE
jgi:hypothetical protein